MLKKQMMVSLYVMIGSIISIFITYPLGIGHISGIIFGITMLYMWILGLCLLAQNLKNAIKFLINECKR